MTKIDWSKPLRTKCKSYTCSDPVIIDTIEGGLTQVALYRDDVLVSFRVYRNDGTHPYLPSVNDLENY